MPAPPVHASSPDADALLRLIDEVVRELQPGTTRRASLDSTLDRELGLDSLSRVELLARLERRFALRLPTEVEWEYAASLGLPKGGDQEAATCAHGGLRGTCGHLSGPCLSVG